MVADEGKDPSPYLEAGNSTIFDHEELREIRNTFKEYRTVAAEKMLMTSSEISPAVVDELRKIASHRAREAKKKGDWKSVIDHLEGYQQIAEEYKEECIRIANQAPRDHTKRPGPFD